MNHFNRQDLWFLEPLDERTKAVLASKLSQENFSRQIECADGLKRDLWQVSNLFIINLQENWRAFGLHFNIYVKHKDRWEIAD